MYYFLGYLFDLRQQSSNHSDDTRRSNRSCLRMENTFLLALDGDIDFKPSAVMMLVDLMKRDLRLGAACGRIHPTGSGLYPYLMRFSSRSLIDDIVK